MRIIRLDIFHLYSIPHTADNSYLFPFFHFKKNYTCKSQNMCLHACFVCMTDSCRT